MAGEILTEAMIYHGPGGCPKCGNLLTVVDHEMTIMNLNQEGHPTSEETMFHAKACCPNCGHKQDMMRWHGIYIPYSRSSRILKYYEAYDNIKERCAKRDLELREKNPFAIDSE